MREHVFTSESVTEGHPDKVCDQIADAILDDILLNDDKARVACEVAASTGLVLVFGEITTEHYCDVARLARDTMRGIGYDDQCGFSADSCAVLLSIDEQSADISMGVNASIEARAGALDPLDQEGAGDQGMMVGYACAESEPYFPGAYMPLAPLLAHALARRLAVVRREGLVPGLRPDGKTQVSLRYAGTAPLALDTVLISTQHAASKEQAVLKDELFEHVVRPTLPAQLYPEGGAAALRFLVNPSGRFEKGGPEADSGLTGRKIIADTYGGAARHGGGSFSGKDPSKVDRSAAYYARYVTKNLVAAGAAERLELQVSYAIGRAHPVSLAVEAFGTARVDETRIETLLASREIFDFRPLAIIESLGLTGQDFLRRTGYEKTAAYGHFGRNDIYLPWEQLDKVDAVKQALGL